MSEAKNSGGGMVRWILILVVIALAVVVYLNRPAAGPEPGSEVVTGSGETHPAGDPPASATAPLPRLLDLGANKCVPCKMMAPILEELKVEFAETFTVEFIDVWQNREASAEYGIKMIPTQIFFGADGNELFRHEGFYGRDEILAKWRELGLEL